jgi:hypothetical protein
MQQRESGGIMRYLVLIGICLLLWGCPGPDCHCPDRESELYVISAAIAPDGGVQILSWVYDHELGDAYNPLDCSCPGNWYYGKQDRLSSSGQTLWSADTPYSDYAYGSTVDAVLFEGRNTVFAAYQSTFLEREWESYPLIYALNENQQQIRHAQVETASFGEAFDMPQESKRILALTDNAFLYYGTRSPSGTIAQKISAYGEVLWTKTDEIPFPEGIYPLDNGDLLRLGDTGVTKLDPTGNEVWTNTVGSELTQVHSACSGADGTIVIAGSQKIGTVETDIIVWETNSEGVVQDSFTLTREGCDDFVRVMYSPFNDHLILASRSRADCAEPQIVRLTFVTRSGEAVGTSDLDLAEQTVFAGMDMDNDGSFIVAVTTNATSSEGRFYGRVYKFYPDYTLDWARNLLP